MIVVFLEHKKNNIDTERWEQRPKRCALAPEFEIEFFLSRKKKIVIMEIRVQLEDRTQVAQPGYGYGYAYTV